MSRWWPERLHVSIFPGRVIAARIRPGWRAGAANRRVGDIPDPGPGPSWQGPLAALGEMLADFGKADVSATVVLSNCFVRYAVVPWQDSVASPSEQSAFARHCFRNIHGAAAEGWDIRISHGGYGRSALASAVDPELPEQLDRLFAKCGIALDSVQPNFMAVCNRFRRQLGSARSGCLAVLEPHRVALGFFGPSGWRTLCTRRADTLKAVALVPLIAQELRLANPVELPEHVFVAAAGSSTCSFFRTRTRDWMSPSPARLPAACN